MKQAKAAKGERVNGECPYGYMIDPNDKNHLLPDPETAPNVRKVFELYTKGLRMCDIQKWLADNKVLTVGALRYQRTGQPRYQKAATVPFIWPDKTLYDILQRQEYLGHTITAKTYKVSYKVKKTKKNPEEKQYFFADTHEPLIDEATFELAQKRIATRNRPNTSDEIDMFSGLLYCADCGSKMGLQRGAGTPERKHSYLCAAYRNRARTGATCTTHYIRKSVIIDLVLADLRRVLNYVKEHEKEFISTASEYSAKEARQALRQQQQELAKATARINEINTVFRKLYEDNALGKLSDQQFIMLTSGYEEEKTALTKRAAELENWVATVNERKNDISRFVKLVGKYSNIEELTYEVLHEFIDRIMIHDLDRETGTRKIEIYYSFVGRVDSKEEATRDISHIRKEMIDVTSYVV